MLFVSIFEKFLKNFDLSIYFSDRLEVRDRKAPNLCSIQCGVGLTLLHLTLNDIQGVLRGEQNNDTSIDVYAEPFFFDIFKSTIDRESTKVGLKALLDLKNDGFAINICHIKTKAEAMVMRMPSTPS